jgi:hypothetical protein
MPLGSIYRVNYRFRIMAQMCMMTWHMRNMDGAAGSGPQALSNLLLTNPALQFRAIQSNSTTQTTIEVIEITGPSPPMFTRSVSPINAGGLGTASILPETAVIWLLRTATPGRAGTGRMYFGGVPANTIVDGFLTSSAFSGHGVRVSNIMAVYGASGSNATYKWVVYSKKNGGLNPPVGTPHYKLITSVDVDTKIASRRTRKIGVGS